MPKLRPSSMHKILVNKPSLTGPSEPSPVHLAEIFDGIADRQGGTMGILRAALAVDDPKSLTDDELHAMADDLRASTPDEPRPTAPDLKPCVYFLRCGRYVKIGTTTRGARRRFLEMQLPPDAHIVAVVEGWDAEQEYALHQMFALHHARGEWFTSTPELEAIIAAHPYVE